MLSGIGGAGAPHHFEISRRENLGNPAKELVLMFEKLVSFAFQKRVSTCFFDIYFIYSFWPFFRKPNLDQASFKVNSVTCPWQHEVLQRPCKVRMPTGR